MTVFLSQLKDFKLSLIHNPKHFFQNNFWIEQTSNGKLILMGISRNRNKNFKKVAILKPKNKTSKIPSIWSMPR